MKTKIIKKAAKNAIKTVAKVAEKKADNRQVIKPSKSSYKVNLPNYNFFKGGQNK